MATHQVMEVMRLNRQGRGTYVPRSRRFKHVLVTGNPSAQMAKDFISEVFHPDHADDAEDLEVVFLFPNQNVTMDATVQYMKKKTNLHIAPRVHILQGTVLDNADLVRISLLTAVGCFVLPNIFATDPMQEDTENVVRVLAVRRAAPQVRVIVLLHKAENKQLLSEGGGGDGSGGPRKKLAAAPGATG